MSTMSASELCAGYEALRAAATGSGLDSSPRGRALLVSQGLAGWMRASVPLVPPAPQTTGVERPVSAGVAGEVVRVLTEMALGSRSALAAS